MDDRNDVNRNETEASAPLTRSRHAGGGGAEAVTGKRFSAKKKLSAVQRLLRGESLDAVSRDLQVPAHRLSEWRDQVLVAAE
ncbi:hypothetical protein HLH48_22775, partial [Gluconacetobacter sacchari]|nr:hypothetical protein [Gluconacetobacter sacchari]